MDKFMFRTVGVPHEAARVKPSLVDCIEAVLAHSDALVNDMLTGLVASANHPQGLQAIKTPAGRAAIAHLATHADALRKTFAQKLRAAVFGGDMQRASDQPVIRFDDFQFLEDEQIDANIEYALTQQEVLQTVEDVLPPFNALISNLLGWVTVQPQLNPLKPEAFVHALRESFLVHVNLPTARGALISSAASILGLSLRQLYEQATDWLRTQGVEPVVTGAWTSVGAGADRAPEHSVARTVLTLDKLRRLLSADLGQLFAVGNDFVHTVPASMVALEDLKLVEPMLKRLSQREASGASQRRPARGNKSAARERQQNRQLSSQLGEEVVRLMLENLMQDERLLPGVRASLKALEPVLVRLALSDPRFFNERQHPARLFLDKITNRSLGFKTDSASGYRRFQKSLDLSVSSLVHGLGDAADFSQVLQELEQGWERNERLMRQRAEDAAKALIHAEQRNLLAQQLAQDFAARVEKKSVPTLVVEFLMGPWAQVVAESQLRAADGAADADGYLGLVDDLIWSVRLRLARRNRARLVELVPGMLVKMRQGLERIAYPAQQVQEFMDALITFHAQAFDGPRMQGAEVQESPVPAQYVAEEAFWVGENDAAGAGYLNDTGDIALDFSDPAALPDPAAQQLWSAQTLAVGSWVDLALEGEWVRAQLTWASPHRTLFMFTSGGKKAHSMSRRTMERLRALGLIRLVSDGRVMDNALDAVALAALRNNRGSAAD
jgi:hypothetical protein